MFGSTGRFSTPEQALASVLEQAGTTAADYERVDLGGGRIDFRFAGEGLGPHRYEVIERSGKWEIYARVGCQDSRPAAPS